MSRIMRAVLSLAVLTVVVTSASYAGSSYAVGDVFLGVANVGVQEYTPTGTLVQTINGGGLSGFVTGMAFQSNGNLLVTDFSTGTVAQYNSSGGLINANFVTGLANPESVAIDSSGNVYVGQAGAGSIKEFSSSGAPLSTTTAATQNRGTDWIDLAANQTTMLYTSEGSAVKSVTVPGGSQNADFSNAGTTQFALRIIPTGAFAGDVLVANSSDALLLNSNGTLNKSYTLPLNGGGDFALNLDANGTDFWTADDSSGRVWEVNIATGAIDQTWLGGSAGADFGLAVFGQQTASGGGGGGSTTPEPNTLILFVTVLSSLGLAKRYLS
jgi:streptogramin lyase